MIHLIYVSSAKKEMNDEELYYLLEQSRARNIRKNITGMLLYLNGNFIQILEGDKKDVEKIYEDIVIDDRNTGNILISKEKINERIFPNWSMGFKHLKKEHSNIPGYTEFLNKEMKPKEIANNPNEVVDLLFMFRNNT